LFQAKERVVQDRHYSKARMSGDGSNSNQETNTKPGAKIDRQWVHAILGQREGWVNRVDEVLEALHDQELKSAQDIAGASEMTWRRVVLKDAKPLPGGIIDKFVAAATDKSDKTEIQKRLLETQRTLETTQNALKRQKLQNVMQYNEKQNIVQSLKESYNPFGNFNPDSALPPLAIKDAELEAKYSTMKIAFAAGKDTIPSAYPAKPENLLYPGVKLVLNAAKTDNILIFEDPQDHKGEKRFADFISTDNKSGAHYTFEQMNGGFEVKDHIAKHKKVEEVPRGAKTKAKSTTTAIGQQSDWASRILFEHQKGRRVFTSAITDLKRWRFVQIEPDLSGTEPQLKFLVSKVYVLIDKSDDADSQELDGATVLPDKAPPVFGLIARLLQQQYDESRRPPAIVLDDFIK